MTTIFICTEGSVDHWHDLYQDAIDKGELYLINTYIKQVPDILNLFINIKENSPSFQCYQFSIQNHTVSFVKALTVPEARKLLTLI